MTGGACPWPLFRDPHQTSPDGIQDDIPGNGENWLIPAKHAVVVADLPQGTGMLLPPRIPLLRIPTANEGFEPAVFPFTLSNQMNMVWHQTVRRKREAVRRCGSQKLRNRVSGERLDMERALTFVGADRQEIRLWAYVGELAEAGGAAELHAGENAILLPTNLKVCRHGRAHDKPEGCRHGRAHDKPEGLLPRQGARQT